MKKIVSIILAITIALTTLPAKADPFDAKNIAGAALLTTGIASAFYASKLMKEYNKEQSKLQKIIENTRMPISYTNYNEKAKSNFYRLLGSHAAGLVSFTAISSGLALFAYNYFNK